MSDEAKEPTMTKRSPEEQTETVAEVCRRCGITRRQAHEWRKLGDMPDAEFEAILAQGDLRAMQAATQRIKRAPVGGHGRIAQPGARLLGSLLALELELMVHPASTLAADLSDHQRATLARVVPSLLDSLRALLRSDP